MAAVINGVARRALIVSNLCLDVCLLKGILQGANSVAKAVLLDPA